MAIFPPEITVNEVMKNLYSKNVKNKRIVTSDDFKKKMIEKEKELKKFLDSDDLTIESSLFPKKCKSFYVECVDGSIEIGKDQMHKFYERLRGPSWVIFEKYFYRLGESMCPYCGIMHSGTLDHILPKKVYFNFSIIPQNLVLCCSTCNGKKQEFIPADTLYYPYKEAPLYDFLEVTDVSVDVDGIHIDLEKEPSKYADYIDRMDLKKRLSNIIENEIVSVVKSLSNKYDITNNDNFEILLNELKNHFPLTLSRGYMIDTLHKLDVSKENLVELLQELEKRPEKLE